MTVNERAEELNRLKDSPELDRLYDDIRTEVSRDLHKFRVREKELSAITPDQLLMMYINWKFRQIHPRPRKIEVSTELSDRKKSKDALLAPFEKEFDQLVQMIALGKDLTHLLSPKVTQKPYELKPDIQRLKDEKHLDFLLNEQGIHHLHLPGLQKKKGTPNLFAIFDREHAFLLDIAPHDDSSIDRLARISYCNWGQRHFAEVKIDALVDGQGNPINLKDQERVFVRNSAVNVPIEIDKGLFVLARTGGVTANGYSSSVVTRCTKIRNSLAFFVVRKNKPGFKDYFEEASDKPFPEDPEFRFRILDTAKDWEYAIVEEKTPHAFLLPNYFGVTNG